MKTVTFSIDEELLQRLDKFSNQVGVSRSDVVRLSIDNYIMQQEAISDPQTLIKHLRLVRDEMNGLKSILDKEDEKNGS